MSQSNPEWYEALQVEPLRSRTFTRELAKNIQERAHQQADRPAGRFVLLRRAFVLGAVALCAAAVMLLTDVLPFMGDAGPNTGSDPSAAAPGPEASGEDASAAGALQGIAADPGAPRPALKKPEPTDEEWRQLSADYYPELSLEMLHKEAVSSDQMLIFSMKRNDAPDYTGVSMYTQLFRWTAVGWNSFASVTYSPPENLQQPIDKGMLVGWYGFDEVANDPSTTITIFSGMVIDPEISKIRLSDNEENIHWATLLKRDDLTCFFVALPPSDRGNYVLQGLNEADEVIYSEAHAYR